MLLTEKQVREIFFSDKSVQELCKEYKRSPHLIYLIRRAASYQKWTKVFKVEQQKINSK